MAEKRSQAEETGITKSSGSRGKQKSRKPGSSQGAKGTKPAGEKGRGTVEQIGAIFSKILELAETGVGLGVNVLSRLSSYAQSETAYRQGEDERHGGGGYPPRTWEKRGWERLRPTGNLVAIPTQEWEPPGTPS